MTQHDAALATLEAWRAPSDEQESLRAAYVAHLRAHPDGLLKPCFPAHLTAGALVISHDGGQVLLNLHRKAQRWFHFGGHIEPDDPSLAAAALREATEESGIPDLVLDPEPVHLSRHAVPFCSDRGSVDHLDVRYVARVAEDTATVISDESLALKWWPVDALPTQESDMLELVAAAQPSSQPRARSVRG